MTTLAETPGRDGPRISRGLQAAFLALGAGIVCIVFQTIAPWLSSWPTVLTLPLTEWVGTGVEGAFEVLKPAARVFSAVMAYPMNWANAALVASPWPLTIGLVTALGWWIGRWPMAALGFFGLGFVLSTGYWVQGMNTLALVAVSVPLALAMGLVIGVFATEYKALRGAVQMLLDVMQTVPTFAYLTPLLFLFGFGPVVGLIASAIYAAPPMARNVILGLERIEPEIKEAAIMSGSTRWQQLVLIEIPAARTQIMVGVNQCLMAALSMVIIAAVIGGFDDIGWEVLLTMRKADFGQALLAGFVIVVFAIVIDRMSGALATDRRDGGGRRGVVAILAVTALATVFFLAAPVDPASIAFVAPVADVIDAGLTRFTVANGAALEAFKNGAMFYGLLPLRIGLDEAVLPFTWGFQWTAAMSLWLFAAAAAAGLLLALAGRPLAGVLVMILAGVIETGVAQLPWPFVMVGAGALAWVAGGMRLTVFTTLALLSILVAGLWDRALLSLYLSGAAVLACVIFGGAIGFLCAVSPMAWRVVRPICDMLQTIPLFVFLIPVLMVFQIGEFSAFLAIIAYAIVPMIRYTRQGLTATPEDLLEAATATGATAWQTMREVRFPYAAPTILLGLNQTILYAFAMLVIAALIGTTGLGQSIYIALGQADVGLGLSAGAAMAILALVADRMVQGFAEERRRALGL